MHCIVAEQTWEEQGLQWMGLGPGLLDSFQVTSVDANGNFIKSTSMSMDEYKLHMLKIQKLMVDVFAVKARANDQLANM